MLLLAQLSNDSNWFPGVKRLKPLYQKSIILTHVNLNIKIYIDPKNNSENKPVAI